jgi:circadian clock protein KaiB
MKPTVTKPPASPGVVFSFRLYIMGDTQNSVEAIANLNDICRTHIPDQHEIEFVDVSLYPERALADGIFMTPTLIKLAPSPTRMVVGTLSNPLPVIQALGLHDGPRASDTIPVLVPQTA